MTIAFVDGKDKPKTLRAYTAIKGQESHRSNYLPTEQVMADPLLKAIALRSM